MSMPMAGIARTYAAARIKQHQVSKEDVPVPSVDAAYEVQSALMENHVGELGQVVGWKVGASNAPAMSKLNVDEPFRGPLFSKYVKRGPASTTWKELGSKLVAFECELCFTMSASLPVRGSEYSEEEVLAAVQSVSPAIEVAAVRAPDALPLSPETLPTCVADSALNGICVLGDRVPMSEWDSSRLESVRAKLAVTETGKGAKTQEVEGVSSRVLGSPVKCLRWLANHLNSCGLALEKGQVVMTGAAVLMVAELFGKPCRVGIELWIRGKDADPCAVELQIG